MTSDNREFTGRHMLAIMLCFFGVIIAVNVTMAVFARTSWTGFVVRNSYVASQEFNDKVAAARAQQALGWSATLDVSDRVASLTLDDREGNPVAIDKATLDLQSPAGDRTDRTVEFARVGSALMAPLDIADGLWVIAMRIRTADGQDWMDMRRIVVRGGNLQ